jgi:hypothetical protein
MREVESSTNVVSGMVQLPRRESSPVSDPWKVAGGAHPGLPRLPRNPPVSAVGEVVRLELQAIANTKTSAQAAGLALPSLLLGASRCHVARRAAPIMLSVPDAFGRLTGLGKGGWRNW